jgi:hypothetical protein
LLGGSGLFLAGHGRVLQRQVVVLREIRSEGR